MQLSGYRFRQFLIFFLLVILPIGVTYAQSLPKEPPPERGPELIRQIYNQETSPEEWYFLGDTDKELANTEYIDADELPIWSRLIYQTYRNYAWDLYILDLYGLEFQLNLGQNGYYPALAENGTQGTYSGVRSNQYDLISISTATGHQFYLTDTPENEIHPTWSPFGNKIAFQSTKFGNYDIFTMNPNGSGVVALTNSPAYDGEPSWSPNGEQIVFVSNRNGYYDLWVMNSDGSDQHQLTTRFTAMKPAWSPLGDQIAFSYDSDGDGFYEVWIMDINGDNLEQFTYVSGGIDYWSPVWSPDAKWLAFIETRWILFDGIWYWTSSVLIPKEVGLWGDQLEPLPDDRIWFADWSSNDALPPGNCTVIPSDQRAWHEIPLQFSALDQGPSGIKYYDGQFRDPGESWQDLVHMGRSDGAIYYSDGL